MSGLAQYTRRTLPGQPRLHLRFGAQPHLLKRMAVLIPIAGVGFTHKVMVPAGG